MDQFIPKEKLSKKVRREQNLSRRKTWGTLNPVTRKPNNPKAYKRRKVQKGEDYELPFEPFHFILQVFLHKFPYRLIFR